MPRKAPTGQGEGMNRIVKLSASKARATDASEGKTACKVALLAVAAVAFALLRPVAAMAARSGNGSSSKPAANSGATRGSTQGPIQVHVNVVNVPVTVLDKQGLPVIDLTKSDFRVYEDGKLQQIRYFSSENRPPLRIGLLVDTSNSAVRVLKFEERAASEFVYDILGEHNSRNLIFLQTFDSTSSLVQKFTNDPDLLNSEIRHLKAGGGKALYDAIYDACKDQMLHAGPREDTRRVIVLISDGIDANSQHTFDEAISMAHRAETAIYTIGNVPWGYSNPGDDYLRRLAELTGGAPFFPLEHEPGTDLLSGYLAHGQIDSLQTNKGLGAETGTYTADRMVQIADSLNAIQEELENQYSIGYTPTDDALDGTYRTIKVVASRKGLVLHYKPGYFATPGN
jgi:Ca-activated chloride channel family protein